MTISSFHLFFDGINPEPWRSPSLGITRRGGKVQPAAYQDENLRAYKEAVHECVSEALRNADELDALPVFPKGMDLAAHFMFWRQLESYDAGTKRRHVRARPDVTNLQKAAEDALQGLIYHDDKGNRRISSELVECGPDTLPGFYVKVWPYDQVVVPLADMIAGLEEAAANPELADEPRIHTYRDDTVRLRWIDA